MTSEGLRRRARNGKGLLPPNPKQWDCEHNGLDVRDDLHLTVTDELPVSVVFDRLLPNTEVRPHGRVPCCEEVLDRFRGPLRSAWSAITVRFPDGRGLVIYNDSHSPARVHATLMEEFFHLRLRHAPTLLRIQRASASRTFNSEIEREAYHSGAAALVPYRGLRDMLTQGIPLEEIANHFAVSRQLVQFRINVTKLGRLATRVSYPPALSKSKAATRLSRR